MQSHASEEYCPSICGPGGAFIFNEIKHHQISEFQGDLGDKYVAQKLNYTTMTAIQSRLLYICTAYLDIP